MRSSELGTYLTNGSIWLFGAKILSAFFTLFTTGLIARLLPTEAAGGYFLALSVVMIGSIIAHLGLNFAALKLVPEALSRKQPEIARRVIVSLIPIALLGALIVGLVLAFFPAHRLLPMISVLGGFNSLGLALGLWVAMNSLRMLFSDICRSLGDIRMSAVFGGFATAIVTFVVFLAIWIAGAQPGLDLVIKLSAGVALIVSVAAFGVVARKVSRLKFTPGHMGPTSLLRLGVPLMLANVISLAIAHLAVFILGTVTSPVDVALYGGAARIVEFVALPFLVVNTVAAPLISRLNAEGAASRLEGMLRMLATLSGVPAAVIMLLFVFFGSDVMRLVYGDSFAKGGSLLAILTAGRLATIGLGASHLVLMLTGFERLSFWINLVFLMLFVPAAILAGESFGAAGVAAATAMTWAGRALTSQIVVNRALGIRTYMGPVSIAAEAGSFT